MKIQIYFILYLTFLIIVGVWIKLFPISQFQQTSCIAGESSFSEGKRKVIECSSCVTYPTQTFQKGSIQIRRGTPQQLKHESLIKQSFIHTILYMQKECIQYECRDLINQKNFQNSQFMKNAGLLPYATIDKEINPQIWQIDFKYDNHLMHQQAGVNSIRIRFLNYLFGPIVPYSILPAFQFYNGMAIKLRFDLPLDTVTKDIQKPIVKLTLQAETLSDLIIVSLMASIFTAIKLKIFVSKNNFEAINLFVSLSFISPYLFSLITLVIMSIKSIAHFLSFIIFVFCLCLDYPSGILFVILLSSLIQLKNDNKILTAWLIIYFNCIIAAAVLLNISSIISTAPIIFYVFSMQHIGNNYEKINNGTQKTNRSENQMIQIVQFQD